jgi:hypothetical protein
MAVWSRHSSVVWRWATDWMIGSLILSEGAGIFLFATASRPALGPIQPPIQLAPGTLSLGVNRPRREADHSPPSGAEVRNTWSYTSTPQYAFMAWCLVKAQGQLRLRLLNWCPCGDERSVTLFIHNAPLWAEQYITSHYTQNRKKKKTSKSCYSSSSEWLVCGRDIKGTGGTRVHMSLMFVRWCQTSHCPMEALKLSSWPSFLSLSLEMKNTRKLSN